MKKKVMKRTNDAGKKMLNDRESNEKFFGRRWQRFEMFEKSFGDKWKTIKNPY